MTPSSPLPHTLWFGLVAVAYSIFYLFFIYYTLSLTFIVEWVKWLLMLSIKGALTKNELTMDMNSKLT